MLSGHWRPDGDGGMVAWCWWHGAVAGRHGGMVLVGMRAWWHDGHEAFNRVPVCMQVALQDLQDRLVPL